jgi:hypothetical protein
MKLFAMLAAALALSAAASTPSSAQVLNLTGQFRCVEDCAGGPPGQPALVTQNGWDMRLVNEVGQPSRAWIDYPGHIWVQSWNEGAVYSADGMTIQFDRGTVWQRDLGQGIVQGMLPAPPLPPPPALRAVPVRRQAAAPVPPAPAALNAFDGNWSVVIYTQSGGCGPSYRYGVRIMNGRVVNDVGDAVDLQGRVAPNGVIRVSVSSGGQQANGEGRLSRAAGGGTWRGEGSAGSCAGVWQATRRS